MLFVTNRVLNEGPTPIIEYVGEEPVFGVPRSVSFALRNNQPEQSVYFCRRNGANDYTEIGSRVFFTELKESPVEQILIYIHGFNNLPENAIFPSTLQLQDLFDAVAPGKVLVVPLIWPCDDDLGLVDDYFDDQKSADFSSGAFARLFEKFMAWRQENSNLNNPCVKWINVLAHSMGNRVLRGTMEVVVRYYRPEGAPLIFRNVFMAASDVINTTLEAGQPGVHITESARNVVVYYAADDLAMRASKVANMRPTSRRLGHTGPAALAKVANNVYALDCSDFNNDYDSPFGHAYFAQDSNGAPGIVFDHIYQCILTGRVPLENRVFRRQILNSRFWL